MNIDEVISRLIINTHTKVRQANLLDIASDVEVLVNHEGGVKEAAALLSLSPSMLSQFLSVLNLPDSIKQLINDRKIDSVSVAHSLNKFSDDDKKQVAKLIMGGVLNSLDVRLLIPLRKQYPLEDMTVIAQMLKDSKDKKVYTINLDNENADVKRLTSVFSSLIGQSEIVGVIKEKDSVKIKITATGEKELRKLARKNKTTLEKMILTIIKW
jgi:hypothetical protein